MAEKVSNQELQCHFCQVTFKWRQSFVKHLELVHETNEKKSQMSNMQCRAKEFHKFENSCQRNSPESKKF